jgi:hypothetical protein
METESEKTNLPDHRIVKRNVSGRVFSGLVVLTVGVVLFAKQSGADLPSWLISWPMLMIAGGVFLGFKHSFTGPVWAILIIAGSLFLMNEIDPTLNLKNYIWPAVIIAVGLGIIFRPQRSFRGMDRRWERRMERRMHRRWGRHGHAMYNRDDAAAYRGESEVLGDDYIDSVTIFGGVQKNIISKTFKGGEVVTIFGGTEINLSQADVSHKIELEITQIFGGAKLIVPAHWKIQSEDIVSIFGSVEDKRPVTANIAYDESKVLVLKGTNIFGGIDIKSY